MPVWPTELPATLNVDGTNYKPTPNSTPIDVESGEPMTRRRFTGKMADIRGTLTLEVEDAIILYNFWSTDCEDGSLPFDWVHPITGAAVEFVWLDTPEFRPIAPEVWEVNLSLRQMP
jgi:hypothetical protein